MSQPRTRPNLSRCWMLLAGWPSQPWSTRKADSRGGHGIGLAGSFAPTFVDQMMIPRGDSRVNPSNGLNGRTAATSAAVTATTIDRQAGCPVTCLMTVQPGAGRTVTAGCRSGAALAIARGTAQLAAVATATNPVTGERRAAILRVYVRAWPDAEAPFSD
jgi:hypothetical protein